MANILPIDPQSKGHIGIAVSAKTVTALVVDPVTRKNTSAISQSNGVLIQSTGVDAYVLTEKLKELKQKITFTTNKVAVILPEKFAFSRMFHIPVTNIAEIDEAVGWQVEKLFPYAKEDIFTDWRLLSRAGNEAEVVVTAIPRILINGIKDGLLAAGLFPVSFEPSVTALARLVPREAKGPVVVIELDESGSSATIVKDGVSQITATAFYQLEQPISHKMSIVAKSVTDLMGHWQKQRSKEELFTLYITGSQVSAESIKLLSELLRIPCQLLPVNPDILPSHHAAYSAAMSIVRPPESEMSINLLPLGMRLYYQAVYTYQVVTQLSVLAIIVLWLMVGISIAGYVGLLGIVRSKTSNLESNQLALVNQVSNLDVITRNAGRYNRLFSKKATPVHILSTIYEAIPDSTTVTNMSYDPGKRKLRLVGKAEDREAVIALRDALIATNLFKTADLPLSVLNTSSSGDFSFELEVIKS